LQPVATGTPIAWEGSPILTLQTTKKIIKFGQELTNLLSNYLWLYFSSMKSLHFKLFPFYLIYLIILAYNSGVDIILGVLRSLFYYIYLKKWPLSQSKSDQLLCKVCCLQDKKLIWVYLSQFCMDSHDLWSQIKIGIFSTK
jgi:hypothetical protein